MQKYFKIILLASFFLVFSAFFSVKVFAGSGGVTSDTYKSAAFSDSNFGKVYLKCTNCTINISDGSIEGYAWGDVVGWINFDTDGSGVTNTSSGVLSGYAWGQNAGWINFNPTNGGVTINPNNGEFTGYAWAQNYGWLHFDCSASGITAGKCVKTDWRPNTGGGGVDPEPPICIPGVSCTDICQNVAGDDKGLVPTGYEQDSPNHCVLTDELEKITPKIKITSPKTSIQCPANMTISNFNIECSFASPVDLHIVADASIEEGLISKVAFYIDGVLLSEDNSLIYEKQWQQSVFPGESLIYKIKAIATDDQNHTACDEISILIGSAPKEPEPTECSDGLDNDSDGSIDLFDPDCVNNEDTSEAGDFCVKNPESPQCTFCYLNPTNQTCLSDICIQNPSDPSCQIDFCTENPDDISCKQNPCDIDPSSWACKLDELPTPIDLFPPEVVEQISLALKITATLAAVTGTIISLATALFLNPLAVPELVLIPFRLWSLLLTALGIKKRVKPWGTVYDSITKQPLDPVYVSLRNLAGDEVASSITDIDGRYGFLVEPGVYKVIPKKTNYLFPSDALSKQFRDEFYQSLYFGDYMNIGAGEVIAKNIPMDPIHFDWNEFAKNKKKLFQFYSKKELWIARVSNWMFNFGFVVAGSALIISPELYNMGIFGFYILMFLVRKMSFKLKAKGRILEPDGTPLAYAFVRVYSIETNVEIAHKVTDQMGRYYMLVPNGTYYVKIEKKNDDGTYTVIHTSNYLKIVHGVLNRVFNL